MSEQSSNRRMRSQKHRVSVPHLQHQYIIVELISCILHVTPESLPLGQRFDIIEIVVARIN
jgi:hypothetical protein